MKERSETATCPTPDMSGRFHRVWGKPPGNSGVFPGEAMPNLMSGRPSGIERADVEHAGIVDRGRGRRDRLHRILSVDGTPRVGEFGTCRPGRITIAGRWPTTGRNGGIGAKFAKLAPNEKTRRNSTNSPHRRLITFRGLSRMIRTMREGIDGSPDGKRGGQGRFRPVDGL